MSARVSDERLANLLMEIADDPMPGCDNDDLALDLRDTRAALIGLLVVAGGTIEHTYNGKCPEYGTVDSALDPDCPACQRIAAAKEVLP